MDTIQERVARGAAWLDSHKPGWEHLISIKTLDMSDTCHCVCGQVFDTDAGSMDGFDYAIEEIVGEEVEDQEHGEVGMSWSSYHGFDYIDVGNSKREWLEYALLAAEWKRVIAERLAAQNAPTRELVAV